MGRRLPEQDGHGVGRGGHVRAGVGDFLAGMLLSAAVPAASAHLAEALHRRERSSELHDLHASPALQGG
jgi:hypothetical protein